VGAAVAGGRVGAGVAGGGVGAGVAGGGVGAGVAGGGVGGGVGVAGGAVTIIGRLIGSRKVSPLQSVFPKTSATQL